MLKKIVLGTLFVGLIAILFIGAIIRTVNKSEDTAQAPGRGRVQNQSVQEDRTNHQDNYYQGTGGQGIGGGRSAAENNRQYPNYQEAIDEWVIYNGSVSQVPTTGVDLIIETDEGELVVGIGPVSLAEQGIDVQEGDAIEVRGYWQDGEFKAAGITLPATGQTLALRDGWGRPEWSGSVGNSRGNQSESPKNDGGASAALDTARQRVGRGGYGGRPETDSENARGVSQAEVDTWITLYGSVTSIDESALVIHMSPGELVAVEGRPWLFAQEQGFSTAVGDEIALTGFYEGDKFEVGLLTSITTNLVIDIRQENGRPLWAGGGRQGY